jgi:cyclopropane fatty-acyl-phospholipid synthase-like methyltransferase
MPDDPTGTITDRSFPKWDELYRERPVDQLPWFFAELDPDVRGALEAEGIRSGTLLDVGTGPGTQALALAGLGFAVTGTDVSQAAVDQASARAAAAGVRAAFVRDDILATKVGGPFDVLLDRGCFHVMSPAERPRYRESANALVKPGGIFLLKCFSSKQPGEMGPYRFTEVELRALFSPAFEVESVRETIYQGTLTPQPLALFAVMRRR